MDTSYIKNQHYLMIYGCFYIPGPNLKPDLVGIILAECVLTCFHAYRLPCNTSKNRYKDVICYDESRVQLKSHPGKEGSDYIHANYVDGFKNPNGFILTQGMFKNECMLTLVQVMHSWVQVN